MNYYSARRVCIGMLAWLLAALQACRQDQDEDSLTEIPGHYQVMDKVYHGSGLLHAERYCNSCHGARLAGGKHFEPSCYACHGKNWLDDNPEESFAPVANHTLDVEGWQHDPGLWQPLEVCITCHGSELQGDAGQRTPSCLLCHGPLWQL